MMDIVNQHSSVEMFVKYQPLKPTNEVVTCIIEPCDVEHGPFYELALYHDKAKVKYSLEHKDSMEVQIVELIHIFAKKVRDVNRSYGKRVW
jgi:hypothetical protein